MFINPYLLLFLALIILPFLLETIVDLLNLSHLSPTLPVRAQGIYDSKKYAKSQTYLKATTSFGLIQSAISLLLTMAFILLGGFNQLDLFARQFGQGEIITGLIFTFLLILISTITSLPFSVYSTFVIEAKFGFNQTTPQTFLLDQLKGLALTLFIGAPILTLLITFFQHFGPSAWLLAWLTLSLIQLFLLFIAPVVLMPIFNKFTPLEKGPLRTKIETFARSQHFKLQGIYTIDGSRRSSKSNAFFTGFGRFKRIALFDTLIKSHSDDEIVAVLAHEIGHYKHHHVLHMLGLSMATTGLMLYLFSLLINHPGIFSAFSMTHTSIYASLVFIGLLFSPVNDLFSVISNSLSRRNEFQADHYAITHHQKPQVFITALKKLASGNLSNLTPHPLKVFLDYSHPPILDRIKAIERSS